MIRKAELRDVPCILHMLRILHGESPTYGDVVPDELYVRENVEKIIERSDVIWLVSEGVGFIVGYVMSQWYDPRLFAYESLIYVLPGFRGTKASPAVDLIVEFEEEAKRRGCIKARMGATTGISDNRTVRLYERLGYHRVGTIVEKSLEAQNVR